MTRLVNVDDVLRCCRNVHKQQQIYINQNNQKDTTEKLMKHSDMKEQSKKSDSLTEPNINLQQQTDAANQELVKKNDQIAVIAKLKKQNDILNERLEESKALFTEQNIKLVRSETYVKECDDRVKAHESKITSNQNNESKLRQNLATIKNELESTRQQQMDAANQELVKKNDPIAVIETKLTQNGATLESELESLISKVARLQQIHHQS
jgi:hypothetical protein